MFVPLGLEGLGTAATLGVGLALVNRKYIVKRAKDSYLKNGGLIAGAVSSTLAQKLNSSMAPVTRSGKRFRSLSTSSAQTQSTPRGRRVRIRGKFRRGRKRVAKRKFARRARTYRRKAGRKGRKKAKGRKRVDYAKDGVMLCEETTGTGGDPNCVYVLAETIAAFRLIQLSIGAILRRLLDGNGFNCSGWDDMPFSRDAGVIDAQEVDYNITLYKYNNQTGFTTVAVTVATTAGGNFTFRAIVEAFVPYIETYSQTFGVLAAGNEYYPVSFVLTKHVRNAADAATGAIQLGQVNIAECMIQFEGLMNMKVQNRTLSVSGGVEADDVASNPVVGKLYKFNGVPKPKNTGRQIAAGTSGGYKFEQFVAKNFGVQLINPANMDPTFQEPPSGKAFWNCYSTSPVALMPGQIGLYSSSVSKQMSPIALWRSIKYACAPASTEAIYSYTTMKTLMVGFEDVINVNAAQNITLAFEVERKTNAVCHVKRKKFMKTNLIHTVWT